MGPWCSFRYLRACARAKPGLARSSINSFCKIIGFPSCKKIKRSGLGIFKYYEPEPTENSMAIEPWRR